ncbi:MAG: BCCT family transporter [Pseudomonadota bacterium]
MQIESSGFFKGVSYRLTIAALFLVVLASLAGALYLVPGSGVMAFLRDQVISALNVYYIPVVALFLIFTLILLVTKWGSIKLGDDDDEPEFNNFAWFAMLFSCGMGIGLLFWSVAEPIFHVQGNPFIPEGTGLTDEAKQVAMRITFLHWGLHPWATYVVIGLTLAYFSYRKKMPLTFRSALYPIFGNRIKGGLGDVVDVIAVFTTVVGVATSLGLGAQQINSGLNQMLGIPISPGVQVMLVVVITLIATTSAVTGLGRGIKFLSVLNIWLSLAILILIVALGATIDLLIAYFRNTFDYALNVAQLSVWIDRSGWQDGWTTFYWAWWITWAPFVGMFIARISRGRTIREFIIGVLFLPTLIGFLWLTIFGNTALDVQSTAGGIIETVSKDVSLAVYSMFDQMDIGALGSLLSFMVMTLVFTYFVTSADSGTLVVTTILAGGSLHPPVNQRIVWGAAEGLVASALLIAGGLAALQTASISLALPFSVLMLLMIFGLIKALRAEK